jgi:hypothetical protein
MSTPTSIHRLSSTQKGAIGENLLVNAVMKASDGRLSPFLPLADDDGIDVLFFDKETGHSVAIQLKCRTTTDGKGQTAQFDVRLATFNPSRNSYLLAALFKEDMNDFDCTWFISMKELPEVSNAKSNKHIITPSKAADSKDKYKKFRCWNTKELAERIISVCNR